MGGCGASIVHCPFLSSTTPLRGGYSFDIFVVRPPSLFHAKLYSHDSIWSTQQVATRLVKSDTIAAVRTIQTILESVDDHGVIDVFKKYPMQDLVASIYALSRLQAATEFFYCSQTGSNPEGYNTPAVEEFPVLDDETLLEELNHYAPYASATYGWKLDLATAGRLHRGDLHALTRITQILPEDVVQVEWESRPHRPVSAHPAYIQTIRRLRFALYQLNSPTVKYLLGILYCSRSKAKTLSTGDSRNVECTRYIDRSLLHIGRVLCAIFEAETQRSQWHASRCQRGDVFG